MNKKTKASPRRESSECICQGVVPLLTEYLRRMGPPQEARRHFEAARLELLKGIRAILDARIEQRSGSKSKGEKISVE